MITLLVEKVTFWDTCISTAVFRKHAQRQLLLQFLKLVSRSADGHLYPVLALLLCLILPDHVALFGIAILLAYGIEVPLNSIIKKTIRRSRPCMQIPEIRNLVAFPDHFSFPSGHTAAACTMAFLLGYYFPLILLPSMLWALLVGFSRLYLGVHYLTDIFAGALIGLLSSLTAIYLTNILCRL